MGVGDFFLSLYCCKSKGFRDFSCLNVFQSSILSFFTVALFCLTSLAAHDFDQKFNFRKTSPCHICLPSSDCFTLIYLYKSQPDLVAVQPGRPQIKNTPVRNIV